MMNRIMKSSICFGLGLFSASLFANNTIKVTVKTFEKKAVAIGFLVENNQHGGLGSSYTGSGPKSKQYTFGYRKDSILSSDITCGTAVLDQDSTITLIHNGTKCSFIQG